MFSTYISIIMGPEPDKTQSYSNTCPAAMQVALMRLGEMVKLTNY